MFIKIEDSLYEVILRLLKEQYPYKQYSSKRAVVLDCIHEGMMYIKKDIDSMVKRKEKEHEKNQEFEFPNDFRVFL
nr:MAG: hypothetical protein [Lokiarchaeota virus Skoll Meg22_1214]